MALKSEHVCTADQVREAFSIHDELVHISIEMNTYYTIEYVPRETCFTLRGGYVFHMKQKHYDKQPERGLLVCQTSRLALNKGKRGCL